MDRTATAPLNVDLIRKQFPILNQKINGKDLVYFDNAATTQKPNRVIDALSSYYQNYNANIHRGIHTLAEKATKEFEHTREVVKDFINASTTQEIIFTRGTTESINLVASSYGRKNLKPGDEVLISGLEHHSNIVPWQMICEERGAILKVILVQENGELDLEAAVKLVSKKTKILAVNHASNSLGTINPIKELIAMAHQVGAVALIDGAQAAPHLEIDVHALDCDFYCLSAHKMYGPTGVGVLFGKKELLENMPPYMGGGEMIKEVTFEKTTYNDLPYKFEAGTPNIGDVIAFKEAISFVQEIGKEAIETHEAQLLHHATSTLSSLKDVTFIGTASNKVSVLSFLLKNAHPFDVGQMLDARGVAVRTGHHCTQPLMDRFGIEGTIRASFALYNTKAEVDYFVESVDRVINIMKK